MVAFPASRFRLTNDQMISAIQSRIAVIDKQIIGLNSEKTKLLLQLQQIGKSFSDEVLEAHNEMMEYFEEMFQSNDFFIPYVPDNYNLFVNDNGPGSSHNGLDDYKETIFPYSMGGSKTGGNFTFMFIDGYFTTGGGNRPYRILNSLSSVEEIVSSSLYQVGRVEVNATYIGGNTRIYKVPFMKTSNLSYYINTKGYNNITWIIDRLSYWAKTTAFLTVSNLALNHYTAYPFGNGIMSPFNIINPFDNYNLSVAQTPSQSLKDSSKVLPNVLQRKYFDRLYDFMRIKNYTKTQAVNILQNFVM